MLSGCFEYQGEQFPGHVPIWVRPPSGSDVCPWTARKRQNFRDVVDELNNSLVLYKLNPETEGGSTLVWLPSLMEALRPATKTNFKIYGADEPFRRVFPTLPKVYIRPPKRGELCPWTGLPETSFRNLAARYFERSKHTKVNSVPLPELMVHMINDSQVPEWLSVMASLTR